MKRLISEKEVLKNKDVKEILIDKNTIITALAEDLCKQLGIKIKYKKDSKKEILEKKESFEQKNEDKKAILKKENLANVLKNGFKKGLIGENDRERMLVQMSEFSDLLEALIKDYEQKDKKESIDLYKIPVGISGRHIHLSKKDLEILFGKDYELTPLKSLSQPGQYACKETLTIAQRKGCIEKVRIIGPLREKTQVEILRADAFKLGIKPVLRLSGDISNTPGVTIIGPKGSLILDEGVIVAKRHIHFNTQQAKERGYKNGDIVSIRVGGERSAILENVNIRVGDNSYLDCHIDQEEANALGLGPKDFVEIVR